MTSRLRPISRCKIKEVSRPELWCFAHSLYVGGQEETSITRHRCEHLKAPQGGASFTYSHQSFVLSQETTRLLSNKCQITPRTDAVRHHRGITSTSQLYPLLLLEQEIASNFGGTEEPTTILNYPLTLEISQAAEHGGNGTVPFRASGPVVPRLLESHNLVPLAKSTAMFVMPGEEIENFTVPEQFSRTFSFSQVLNDPIDSHNTIHFHEDNSQDMQTLRLPDETASYLPITTPSIQGTMSYKAAAAMIPLPEGEGLTGTLAVGDHIAVGAGQSRKPDSFIDIEGVIPSPQLVFSDFLPNDDNENIPAVISVPNRQVTKRTPFSVK